MIRLWNSLKHRHVVQWSLAYAAGAWLVLQVLQLLSDAYHLPGIVMQLAPVLLAIGLVAVVILAWYHGEKGAQRVSGPELIMMATLLLIAGLSIALFVHPKERATRAAADAPATASIAVLPFRNFSSDKEQEYFSDGITEEILNALAQISGLQVAARTSSFAFKEKDVPIDEIGTRLHVAHVLEGSVRKSGNKLRITAQLINARTGYHVWSQQFDRDATDVFAVQDEIARNVANALQVSLGEKPVASAQPVSDAAHNEYLLGLFSWNKRTSQDVLAALRHFERATELQPDYAAAWAGLANTWGIIPVWVDTIPGTTALPQARRAAEKAITLDPDLPEAHAAMAWVKATADHDWQAADEHFERALALNPSYATALQWWGESLQARDPQRAIQAAQRAVRADPLSKIVHLQLGTAYANAGQPREALRLYEETVALDSTWYSPYNNLLYVLLTIRDRAGAEAVIERSARNTGLNRDGQRTIVRGAFDERARAQGIAAARTIPNITSRAIYLSLLGDREGALAAFAQAVQTKHTDETRLVYFPGFKPWRNDPRYIALVRSMKLDPPK